MPNRSVHGQPKLPRGSQPRASIPCGRGKRERAQAAVEPEAEAQSAYWSSRSASVALSIGAAIAVADLASARNAVLRSRSLTSEYERGLALSGLSGKRPFLCNESGANQSRFPWRPRQRVSLARACGLMTDPGAEQYGGTVGADHGRAPMRPGSGGGEPCYPTRHHYPLVLVSHVTS
jgi:hypothetical protein